MSFGRDNDGLPGQSRGGGTFDFPGSQNSDKPRGRMPSRKAGGGGIAVLMLIVFAMFFMMRSGSVQPPPRNNGNVNEDDQTLESSKPWRSAGSREQAGEPSRDNNRINIPGFDDSKKSDRVEKGDWSTEDVAIDNKKGSDRQPFPNEGSFKSDEVKTDDGWSTKDATEKGKRKK